MERILIIGGCGAGKTTLSRQLAEKLQLPLIHLDRLYWRDNWESVSTEVFDGLLMQELIKPRWILDGNFTRTLPLRLRYCDTVIYLDFSGMQCVYGVIQRLFKNYGKSRPDMGGDCPERFDREKWTFLQAEPETLRRLAMRKRGDGYPTEKPPTSHPVFTGFMNAAILRVSLSIITSIAQSLWICSLFSKIYLIICCKYYTI